MRKYCDDCKGGGKVTDVASKGGGVRGVLIGATTNCKTCNGKGYTNVNPYDELKEEVNGAIECIEIIVYNEMFEEISLDECKGQLEAFNIMAESIEEQEKEL